jgi:hypothetical protein
MLRTAVLTTALAGCTAYQPGSFHRGPAPGVAFEGERATVGCLDVAISRRVDYDASAVLQYRFGNRCNRPVEVDLQRVAVVGRFGDGNEVALAPYDPRLELRPVRVSGRRTGREAIAYPTPRPATQVCVDAASLVHAEPARWMCFGSPFQADTERDDAEGQAADDGDAEAEAGTDPSTAQPEATP